ncbi:hypothetical protein N7451_003644 [Penicillium sp. IBT 35674x]|nr:hypothetical protein N7451_003644 [Penicillium sp. IBT 35674x]
MFSVTGRLLVIIVLPEKSPTGVLTRDPHRRLHSVDPPPSSDERSGSGMCLSPAKELANSLPHWTKPIQQSHQLGYSSITGSNSFVELERVFEGNKFQNMHTTYNRAPTPPSPPCTEALSLISRLPPKDISDELITTFFSDVNWHYCIVEKFYFNDLYSRWSGTETSQLTYLSSYECSQELRYFPCLLFHIVALSLQFLPPGAALWKFFGEETSLSQKYSDMGVELFKLLGGQGIALTAVQASLLRASWLKNLGRGIDAWRSLANAIRLSQELGLHRQKDVHQSSSDSVEESLACFWYNDYKKRVWINLYTWDSLMALVLGRPMMISDFDCDTKLPIDCDIPDLPSRTVPMSLSNSPENRPSSLSASLVSTKPVLRHHNPDTSWDSQYPYLPQQREELFTIVFTFLTALHRPHINAHVESLRAVLQAGIAALDSQQRLFDLTKPHHYMLCHLSFYTVDAAILLSVVIALYPRQMPEDIGNIHRVLQQAVLRLSQMAPVNPTAQSGLDIIQRCYHGLQGSSESSLPANVAPAPLASGVELQDIPRALGLEQPSYQDYMPAEPTFSPDNFTHDFSTMDGSATTHYFDQSYWLHQVDGIYSTANHALDLDSLLELRPE